MKEYLSSIQDVLKEQNTSEEGLSSQEAAGRLEKFGHNKLKVVKRKATESPKRSNKFVH